tara:strand:+ start:391 stop:1281 length:891 start_codon:yes stop_codon:yes gene_type:complete
MNTQLNIPTIADNNMLVSLKRKKPTTSVQVDADVRDTVREQLGDESLTLSKHLFKTGGVRVLLRKIDRIYDWHKQNTVPYVDRGDRILPGTFFEEYAAYMLTSIEDVDITCAEVIANWDMHIHEDMHQRTQKANTLLAKHNISQAEYPTAQDAAHMFSVKYRVKAIPKGEHLLTVVPQWQKDQLNEDMVEIVDIVRADLISRMLKPVAAAVEKLSIPIGDRGSVFRDTLIDNLQEALSTARQLNIGDDPKVTLAIEEMSKVVHGHIGSSETMRTLEGKRKEAADKLSGLLDTLGGL